jgi:hypothetical protein
MVWNLYSYLVHAIHASSLASPLFPPASTTIMVTSIHFYSFCLHMVGGGFACDSCSRSVWVGKHLQRHKKAWPSILTFFKTYPQLAPIRIQYWACTVYPPWSYECGFLTKLIKSKCRWMSN